MTFENSDVVINPRGEQNYFFSSMDEILAFAKYFQNLLNLGSWEIRIQVVSQGEMPNEDALGACLPMPESHRAWIKLLDPGEHVDPEWPYDMQFVLVHELLHVVTYPLKVKLALEEQEEAAINQIAHAMIDLYRAGKPVSPPALTEAEEMMDRFQVLNMRVG